MLNYDLTITFIGVHITQRRPPEYLFRKDDSVADYKKMYHKIFNSVTDAEQLVSQAARMMLAAQLECEEMYTGADDTPIALADRTKE